MSASPSISPLSPSSPPPPPRGEFPNRPPSIPNHPPHPQPGAGKRLRNGHCFFGGEPQCCSLKHFNRRNSNTRRKKEAGLRDKQNPPRHKPVPDFLPQPLFSSRVRVCFLIFFFLLNSHEALQLTCVCLNRQTAGLSESRYC